jgi:2-oxoglutarate ferredoxin oxidoreductase subunit alpha
MSEAVLQDTAVADAPQNDILSIPPVDPQLGYAEGVGIDGWNVNHFSIMAATKNGSGSQTANAALLRAFFKMGIPVSGKNLFPSNIQGRPTWYTIRVNAEGWIARRDHADIVVAMNPETAIDDHSKVAPEGVFIYSDDIKIALDRKDVSYYPIPAKKIAGDIEKDPKLKTYAANMVYVGLLAWLLGIDLKEIEAALMFHFRNKEKPVKLNMAVINAAIAHANANLKKTDHFKVQRMDKTKGMIMLDGNTAGALGAIYGGVSFVGWYPITPATSLADALDAYLPVLRKDADGKPSYSVVQAEDELAALGMVMGAGWAGARAMTSTSGPGISLMAEFSGYGYFAEIPAVIWDVQRMGPATGLPTRVSQGDVLKTYFLGHGDSKHVVLLPGDVYECFEFGWRAFDIAEKLQTPVFVLSDLDIGMNQWMSRPFDYPNEPMQRGKVLTAEDVAKAGGFARYKDVDGDGIGPRTLPGTDHALAAYFTRGSGHNEKAYLSEKSEDWVANMERLNRKFETARHIVPQPVLEPCAEGETQDIGIIYFGSTQPAVDEGRHRLDEAGIKTDALRLRALPLNDVTTDFVKSHKKIFVIELNTDAQVCQLLRLHVPDQATKIQPLNNNDGLPLTAKWIVDNLK